MKSKSDLKPRWTFSAAHHVLGSTVTLKILHFNIMLYILNDMVSMSIWDAKIPIQTFLLSVYAAI